MNIDFIREHRDGTIAGVIYGDLPNKSNSRRLFNGRSIKSQAALDFVERVCLSAGLIKAPLVGATNKKDFLKGIPFIELSVHVHADSFKRDLDCELIPDALQKAGVVKNDRAIREKHLWWTFDEKNPRIEFEIRLIPRK